MTTKQEIAEYLKAKSGEYISGQQIANHLNISRSAVWKAINQLEKDGYKIEAVKNRGYMLVGNCDDICNDEIMRYLKNSDYYKITVFDTLDSTNTKLLDNARNDAPSGTVYVAKSQSAGKGRLGRAFLSQSRNGLYFSILQKGEFSSESAAFLTTIAAVAVCKAIESFCDAVPSIKWVNDIYINSKKVCGILTQAMMSVESRCVDCVVIGIGINVFEPVGGFDEDIKNIAGAVLKNDDMRSKSQLLALVLDEFKALLDIADDKHTIMEEYRRRCFVLGRQICVLRGNECFDAVAKYIDDDCALYVEKQNGEKLRLVSGEISIRL